MTDHDEERGDVPPPYRRRYGTVRTTTKGIPTYVNDGGVDAPLGWKGNAVMLGAAIGLFVTAAVLVVLYLAR